MSDFVYRDDRPTIDNTGTETEADVARARRRAVLENRRNSLNNSFGANPYVDGCIRDSIEKIDAELATLNQETTMDPLYAPDHVAPASPADARHPRRVAQEREERRAAEGLRAIIDAFILDPRPAMQRQVEAAIEHFKTCWMEDRTRD